MMADSLWTCPDWVNGLTYLGGLGVEVEDGTLRVGGQDLRSIGLSSQRRDVRPEGVGSGFFVRRRVQGVGVSNPTRDRTARPGPAASRPVAAARGESTAAGWTASFSPHQAGGPGSLIPPHGGVGPDAEQCL